MGAGNAEPTKVTWYVRGVVVLVALFAVLVVMNHSPVSISAEQVKMNGICMYPVQQDLRFHSDHATADRICCHNHRYAEHSGYLHKTTWVKELRAAGSLEYFDATSGKRLFFGPKDRSLDVFIQESTNHGWPSFRDSEVDWEFVRVHADGEVVSVDGTHLGHNLPDAKGNRYCINLVCIAGNPGGS